MNGRKNSDLLSTRNCRLQIMHHKSSMFLIMLRKETWLMELTIFERNARPIINVSLLDFFGRRVIHLLCEPMEGLCGEQSACGRRRVQ